MVEFNGTIAVPTSWSDTSITVPVPSGASTGPVVVLIYGLSSYPVVFTVTQVSITVTTNPPGRSIPVDRKAYTSPHSCLWTSGTTHTIATTSTQGNVSTQYLFSNWSDGGAISHTITVPTWANTYTANFRSEEHTSELQSLRHL